jgi:pilus assembly protein CpaC
MIRLSIRLLTALSLGASALTVAGPALTTLNAADVGASVISGKSTVARRLQLGVGKSVIIDLPEDASEIFVGEPKIANAIVRSPRRIYVDAIANGETTIFAMDSKGRQIAVLEISVGRDVAELQELLRASIPGNDITVKTVADSVILMGSVASAGEAQKAIDIATSFTGVSAIGGAPNATASPTPGGGASLNVTSAPVVSGKVINSMTIRGLDQVMLRVKVSEIRRDIVKQLGVNLAGQGAGSTGFKVDNPFSLNGAITDTEGTLGWSGANGTSLSATLQAFERQGVARTLAEPTVTAMSGESAKFLAGGEVPVPQTQTCSGGICQIGFQYNPYGVSLSFTPVVQSGGRIQLRVATEVTDIDNEKQLVVGTLTIPAFRTRKNETTVELPSGGSIVSAGLLSTETQQAVSGVPALMNLPVLGALFRSRDFLKQQTELLIVVTPYIAHALNPSEVVKPDQNFVDATDPQTWLLGRVNQLYSTTGAARPVNGYRGHIGFIND